MKKQKKSEEPAVPKKRKESEGPIRNKVRTQARLINAVGEILEEKGYHGLTPPNIANATGIDKRLVWTYFGGMDNLVEAFFQQKDFWKSSSKDYIDKLLESPDKIKKEDISTLLNNQLNTLLNDIVLQKLIHWELGENLEILRKIADEREKIGEQLFKAIEPDFKNSDVNLRATLALLIGGVYYLSLHAKSNGSSFCGIDINEKEGKEQIEKAIQSIINTSFEKANVK